jgi:RNA recognition motif-containing protein
MGKRLFVRNLGSAIDATGLEDLFMTVGNVEKADVVLDEETGASRGYGYVEMSTEQEAVDCISRFHGQKANGSILIVTEDKPHVPIPGVHKVKAPKAQRKGKARA